MCGHHISKYPQRRFSPWVQSVSHCVVHDSLIISTRYLTSRWIGSSVPRDNQEGSSSLLDTVKSVGGSLHHNCNTDTIVDNEILIKMPYEKSEAAASEERPATSRQLSMKYSQGSCIRACVPCSIAYVFFTRENNNSARRGARIVQKYSLAHDVTVEKLPPLVTMRLNSISSG
jgi:hypothetical protein